MSSKSLLLILIVLIALLGGGLFLLDDSPDDSLPPIAIDPAKQVATPVDSNPWGGAEREKETLVIPEVIDRRGEDETTVAYPLEVRIEMLESSADPHAEGLPRKGTGGNSKIIGLIRGLEQQGVSATVTIIGGANAGRVLHTDHTGAFGATDLFPGLTLARIVSGRLVAEREVSLRQGRETQLNVSFHRTSDVTGEVIDQAGKPLEGAVVRMDGQETRTDYDGVFRFGRMTPGKLYVQVDMPGYASHRENLPIAGGHVIERGTIKFTLAPGASLRINIAERLGSRGDALLFFLPSAAVGRDRRFPWHEHNPTRVVPGGSVLLEDLPAERVNLWLFHTGAEAAPAAVAVRLRQGTETTKTLHLKPAVQIKGVVKKDGEPVRRARVTSEVPDRVSATMAKFGGSLAFFDSALMPPFPSAVEEVYTDDEGKFAITAWDAVAKAHYVTALSQDGEFSACKIVPTGTHEVELNLEPIDLGESTVEVSLPERFQGLPVKVWVDGAPREPFVLPSDRKLEIPGLSEGVWTFQAKWRGQELKGIERFDLKSKYSIPVNLPEGAILGQTPDELERAKKP